MWSSDDRGGVDSESENPGPLDKRLDQSLAQTSPSNVMSISGDGSRTGFITAMQRSIQLGGQSAFVLRILLSKFAGVAAGENNSCYILGTSRFHD